ncbi:MAG: glycine--tRNA ligase [Waddliaceae bacterium]
MASFQDILSRLSQFWERYGCIIHQGYDLEVGAGTMNPATFLRCLGPEPYRAAYVEPSRRPADGRYGENPNRVQHFFQYQVILKPSPLEMQDLYLDSLKAIGINLHQHDIRFVHDDWENPTIGASGLGWEVWIDGMEITQYTYFQSFATLPQHPVTGELTYGLERLAMYLQNVDSIFDVQWNGHLTYRDLYHRQEVEWSTYNFEKATVSMWLEHFNAYEKEAIQLIAQRLPIPAYEFVMKASHAFNILDARGAISVTERTGYISRMRDLARAIGESYIESRKNAGFPLLNHFGIEKAEHITAPPIPEKLLLADPSQSDNFLLEIGSEELPAAYIPIGLQSLEHQLKELLNQQAIPYRSVTVYGSPRRLAALIEGLAMGLPEQTKERRGPTLDKAYDTRGVITPAGRGFFRSIDQEPPSLDALKKGDVSGVEVRTVKGADYIFAAVKIPGVSTASVLAQQLPGLIQRLDFPKTMRWGDLDISYARPLRWLAALFGKEVVPFVIGGILSGRGSYGHRQLDPAGFSLSCADDYLEQLKHHHVMADPEERKKIIAEQLDALEKTGKHPIVSKLLDEVVNMVEWPHITEAAFDAAFLNAPEEVLISEMVEHQKYFPLRGEDGKLLNRFVITTDTTPTDHIRHGNQRVLSSRLADGVFLYEKGRQLRLEDYNAKLKHVTYLAGFGSLYDKMVRLQGHMKQLQKQLNISTQARAVRAAELSKADLATEMVAEFPELQGTIGKYYAIAQGEEQEVSQSIEEQWMPRGENAPLPKTETGTLLSLADKIDHLISCFSAGLRPTSSSDPYALRRQALGMVKIFIERKLHLPFKDTLEQCAHHFSPEQVQDKLQVIEAIEAFFINRMKTVFQEYGLYKDEVEASVANGFSDIYDTFCKVQALHKFRQSSDKFQQLYEVYKRAKGQLDQSKPYRFSQHLLQEEAEKQLDIALTETQAKMNRALDIHDYDEAYQLIALLQPLLARLFDEVRILADDPQLRHNRMALLQRVFSLFSQLLDFSKISERK